MRRSLRSVVLASGLFLALACHREKAADAPSEWVSPPHEYASSARTEPEKARATAGSPAEETQYLKRYGHVRAHKVYAGKAAYYGDALAGRKTASGEVYNPKAFTAAHRSLPFGTILRVVRADKGKQTYVRVTDRGPFGSKKRIIDLSKIAAERLDMLRDGVVDVRVEVVEWGGTAKKK